MFRVMIDTEILIDAAPGRVWEVLTDFASYPDWNPMIRRASGDLTPGARLNLHFEPEGQKGKDFRPKLMTADPGRELRWLGNPGFKGLLESQHYFILEGQPGGKTRLLHGMDVYGLLGAVVGKKLESSTTGPFTDMNRALKARAESA